MLLKFVEWIYIKREVPELIKFDKIRNLEFRLKNVFLFFYIVLTFGHLLPE